MYDEAGRLMRDDFWSPDMCGVDWDGVLAKYRPLLDRVASRDDFADLLWEVLGELGTSHAYVIAGRAPRRARPAPLGLLGADLRPGRRPLAGGPDPARRVLRPARPLPARRARASRSGPGTRSSPWTGGRSTRGRPARRCWPAPPASRSS